MRLPRIIHRKSLRALRVGPLTIRPPVALPLVTLRPLASPIAPPGSQWSTIGARGVLEGWRGRATGDLRSRREHRGGRWVACQHASGGMPSVAPRSAVPAK
jgi:hypothetical protein